MTTEIIVTKINDCLVSGWMRDYRLVEFSCVFPENEELLGNIYVGKVKNIVKNINGAFVEYKKGKLGFLPLRNRNLKVDDEILVQLKKEATTEKKPLLSWKIELTGRYVVLTSDKTTIGISGKIRDSGLRRELKELISPCITDRYGFILRTGALSASKEEIVEEAEMLGRRYDEIMKKAAYRTPFSFVSSNQNIVDSLLFGINKTQISKVVTDQPELAGLLEREGIRVELLSEENGDIERRYRIAHTLKEALKKKVWMKSGGFLYVEETEAMAVIDVNTGKSIGNDDREAHIRKTNLEAAKEAARQIRLRNLSGIIIIDFIDMNSEEERRELLTQMQKYLDDDSKKAVAVDITKLGLMEITRKREKNSLLTQIGVDICK